MKNITITLDNETAALARRHAAEKGVSLSRFVGEVLGRHLHEASEYERAMRQFLAQKPVKLKTAGQGYPSRDEAHERTRLR